MALDYLETAALMTDQQFIDRTKVACLHYASYIVGEAPDTPAHNTRMRWAKNTLEVPHASAQQIMPTLVMDDKVQTSGAAIPDADLQIAVETSVNMMF